MRESLLSFNERQIRCVRFVAAHIARQFQFRGGVYDVEAAVKDAIASYPILRGLSVQEITKEVLFPGSFGGEE